mmetsp:Transcript_26440/g.75793  ORF Transcript_26440/g.75793 Transcript_26440/m.75793 type:complete len:336 (+) Transcript_26440:785-1792(+)
MDDTKSCAQRSASVGLEELSDAWVLTGGCGAGLDGVVGHGVGHVVAGHSRVTVHVDEPQHHRTHALHELVECLDQVLVVGVAPSVLLPLGRPLPDTLDGILRVRIQDNRARRQRPLTVCVQRLNDGEQLRPLVGLAAVQPTSALDPLARRHKRPASLCVRLAVVDARTVREDVSEVREGLDVKSHCRAPAAEGDVPACRHDPSTTNDGLHSLVAEEVSVLDDNGREGDAIAIGCIRHTSRHSGYRTHEPASVTLHVDTVHVFAQRVEVLCVEPCGKRLPREDSAAAAGADETADLGTAREDDLAEHIIRKVLSGDQQAANSGAHRVRSRAVIGGP